MTRLESILRLFTEGMYVDMLNGRHGPQREQTPAEIQKRYGVS
jgi:hypothetical protein